MASYVQASSKKACSRTGFYIRNERQPLVTLAQSEIPCCKMASFWFKIPLNKHCPEALELLCILRMIEGCMSDAAHCILDLAFVHQTLVLGLMVN